MNMLYDKIITEFNEEVNQLRTLHPDWLKHSNLGLTYCIKTVGLLRKKVEKHGFDSLKDEITFFKTIKVEPMKYLIYFTEVRSTELRLPKVGLKQKLDFVEEQIKKANLFFGRNIDFLLYMEQNLTHFDKVYFVRKNVENGLLVKSYPYYKDPMFNTSHDGILARIRAMSLYVDYLKFKKGTISKEVEGSDNKHLKSDFKWTGPYAALVELVYGCNEMGYVNNGNTSIQDIMETFCDFLNVKRGNHTRTYNELKARTGSQIKFFDEAGQKLIEKMNKEDGLDS